MAPDVSPEAEPQTADKDLPNEAEVKALEHWIMQSALTRTHEPLVLFNEVCDRLSQAGLPLVRGMIALRTLHPLFNAVSMIWHKQDGYTVERHAQGSDNGEDWERSPIKALIDSGRNELRVSLEGPDAKAACERMPLMSRFQAEGGTDWLGILSPLSGLPDIREQMDGLISSWLTDQPGGWRDDQLGVIQRIAFPLALFAKVVKREKMAVNVASAYLGPDAGQRVLDGQIRLGDSVKLNAVLWYSDMRSSTPLAHKLGPDAFLERLNAYFAHTAGAVMDHGGEVLRFIGDAVLAIFEIDGPGGDARAARMAHAAVRDTLGRINDWNDIHISNPDDIPMGVGIGLHVGQVLYGNIGVPDRLEFSVIGKAANEVARIESMTKELGESVLASEEFAFLVQADWRNLGKHRLRGVERDIGICGLPCSPLICR
ncbi:MAG: adenylate/guanylate cyclase domain-containing protein [Magnetovibrionaceae bacterium]